MIIDLKPCPFCTCTQSVQLETIEGGDGKLECAQVVCDACLAKGPEEPTKLRAIQIWNEAPRAA